MMTFTPAFILYIIASFFTIVLAAALPFAIWYYLRAKEIAPFLIKKEALKVELEGLEQKILEARNEFKNLADEMAQARQMIKDSELAKKWIEDNEPKINDIKSQIAKKQEEFEVAKVQLEDLKQKVSDKQNELAEQNAKLDNSQKGLDEIKRTHNKLEIENSGLISKNEELKHDVNYLERTLSELKDERTTLNEEISKLKDEIAKLEKNLTKTNNELTQNVQANNALQEANQELAQENNKLSEQIDKLRSIVEQQKIVIARAEAIQNNEANMWKDLERDVAHIVQNEGKKSIAKNEQETALKKFKELLDACGYAFSERTIKAFHTGLLCGKTSPLVVLSGISGTGKSLLPELYAKAFHMNFLPVAVQPRWDGPQDIFGFYNHMEGRFKATEFSRLLWQFDVYNNPRAKKRYSNNFEQLPLSLVLLDEMNLARVEYYFSELLSKLEIRNRVTKMDNKEERLPAEIELEYGASSLSTAENSRRLFIGHNILLVGTMNEDESTQTLSSKVIDRSNVLRFGTPESLSRQPDEKSFADLCTRFVSFDTWSNWQKNSESTPPELDEYIKELKNTMQLVNRGFGHRTERAIKQYVSCYPGSKKDAIADQIEMKILPKLNGIENGLVRDKVAESINKILGKIGDTDVAESLEHILQSDAVFFNWQGVKR